MYNLGLSGQWAAGSVTCGASPVTIQLPEAGKTCSDAAVIATSRLYTANTPVAVSPALPSSFPRGESRVS